MTRVLLAPEITNDFDRIIDHIARHSDTDASQRVANIIEAISVLQHNPLIGQLAPDNLHELVIGKDHLGDIALYRYVVEIDTIFILAIRSQREAGYAR